MRADAQRIRAEEALRAVGGALTRVEVLFRNLKSELAIQSLRVSRWEDRLKLLGLVTLASAFLMELMGKEKKKARDWLIEYACHRTGSHLWEVELPFSRLRQALSRLWLAYPCWFVRRGRRESHPSAPHQPFQAQVASAPVFFSRRSQ